MEERVVAREQPGLAVLVGAPPGCAQHLAEGVFQELAAAVRLPAGVHPHARVRVEELQFLGARPRHRRRSPGAASGATALRGPHLPSGPTTAVRRPVRRSSASAERSWAS